MKHGKTIIQTRMPWGLFVRRGTRLLCADGKVRSVSYIAQTADTFFSIPAAVKIQGKTVTGYACTEEETWIPGKKTFARVAAFRKHTNQKNADLLPDWPDKLKEPEKWNALISENGEVAP